MKQTINIDSLRKELILSILKHVYGHSKNFCASVLMQTAYDLERYILNAEKEQPTEPDKLSKGLSSD
jgi:hypothetical protein